MCQCLDEARYRAEKLSSDINLVPLLYLMKIITLVALKLWTSKNDDVMCKPRIVIITNKNQALTKTSPHIFTTWIFILL